ncbi:hypothetical protein AB0C04_26700 [Micromonospora sp. NPDC048909]|uniref:hypothetical protein n=1 Tax=Micromonospora sp. NPDC048909 TaxID=3155643 RepID=UPI003403E5F4
MTMSRRQHQSRLEVEGSCIPPSYVDVLVRLRDDAPRLAAGGEVHGGAHDEGRFPGPWRRVDHAVPVYAGT